MLNWFNWFRDSGALMTDSWPQGNGAKRFFCSHYCWTSANNMAVRFKIRSWPKAGLNQNSDFSLSGNINRDFLIPSLYRSKMLQVQFATCTEAWLLPFWFFCPVTSSHHRRVASVDIYKHQVHKQVWKDIKKEKFSYMEACWSGFVVSFLGCTFLVKIFSVSNTSIMTLQQIIK